MRGELMVKSGPTVWPRTLMGPGGILTVKEKIVPH